MTAVEVIARALCAHGCSNTCSEWEDWIPSVRYALDALETHYTLVPKPPPITAAAPQLLTDKINIVTHPAPKEDRECLTLSK
jgi:hypothetical protein